MAPNKPLPLELLDNHNIELPEQTLQQPLRFVNSDWADDITQRKSYSGTAIFLAGAPIIYKVTTQKAIVLRSTKAEFVTANAGKMTIYLQTVLEELGFDISKATPIHEDNVACIQMDNTQHPTRHTRHLDIHHFVLLQWIETNQLVLTAISSSNNPADALTKPLHKTLFS